ncbi:MAG: phosphatase PAP2 family protein [Bacteroidetes bacterium]|nr:phosphatase PAP2 family protein [Bacteroidota bacterium]
MKKFILILWLTIVSLISLFSQSPYQLKLGREIGLYGAGIGVIGGAFYFEKQVKPLTALQISGLNANDLSSFERWVTTRRSVRSHKTSNVLLYSSNFFPVALTFADKKMRKDASTIGVMYTQAAMINLGLTALVKNTVHRTRPYVYQSELSLEEKMTTSARLSFWSGHTSQTATMCFLTAKIYADYHPGSRWKPVMWTAAATIPAATGIFRMTAGKHFPTDVLVGYITGAAIGYFVPKLHQRMDN